MHQHLRGALIALAALSGLLGLASTASAATTHTAITSPSDAYFDRFDYDLTDPYDNAANQVTIAGTSDNVDTGDGQDSLEIRCYPYYADSGSYQSIGSIYPGDTVEGSEEPALSSDGSFRQTFSKDNWTGYQACVLRAVPSSFGGDDLSAFSGPRTGVGYKETYRGADEFAYDYYLSQPQLGGSFEYDSAGSCGLYSHVYSTGTFRGPDYYVFNCNAYMWLYSPRGDQYTSTRVDGHNGYLPTTAPGQCTGGSGSYCNDYYPGICNYPYFAHSGAYGCTPTPGSPQMTFSATAPDADGNITISEVDPIARCSVSDERPPTSESCPEMVSTGVQLVRTIKQDSQGRRAVISDVLQSTDGAAHSAELEYENDYNEDNTMLFRLPGRDYEAYESGDTVDLTGHPVGVILSKDNENPDGNRTETGNGAIAYSGTADKAIFYGTDGFYLRFKPAVPAGGSTAVGFTYCQGLTEAEASGCAAAAQDKYGAPTAKITSPANGAAVSASPATVTVAASDDTGVASVTVNGVAASSNGNGTYSAAVPLVAGNNVLTAVAKDAQGNQATDAITVKYTPAAAPAVVRKAPGTISQKVTPSRDKTKPYTFTVKGKLALPSGVKASDGCNGKMALQTKAGKGKKKSKTISSRRTKLKSDCSFKFTVKFRSPKRLGDGKLKMTLRFLGNKFLLPKKDKSFYVRAG